MKNAGHPDCICKSRPAPDATRLFRLSKAPWESARGPRPFAFNRPRRQTAPLQVFKIKTGRFGRFGKLAKSPRVRWRWGSFCAGKSFSRIKSLPRSFPPEIRRISAETGGVVGGTESAGRCGFDKGKTQSADKASKRKNCPDKEENRGQFLLSASAALAVCGPCIQVRFLACKFASLACRLSHHSGSLLTLSTNWVLPKAKLPQHKLKI